MTTMHAIIWKDIVLELRRRDTVFSLFVLGVLILLVFALAIDVEEGAAEVAPGALWIAVTLAATLGMGRTFALERENDGMTGLMLAPIDRGTVFIAKWIVNLLTLMAFEALFLPAFCLIFSLPPLRTIGALLPTLVAANIGLAAVGTLFALAALGTRARELMLPLLVLPLQTPLLIAAVRATQQVLGGSDPLALGAAGSIMVAYDIVFVALGWIVFEYVAVE